MPTSPPQLKNAYTPIVLRLVGNTNLANDVTSRNDSFPIDVTVFGTTSVA